MSICQRCDSWANGTTNLIGDVVASLCAGCRTEFAGLCMSHPLRDEYRIAKTVAQHLELRAMAGDAPSLDEVLDSDQRLWDLNEEFRPFALAFIQPPPKGETAAS